MPSLFRRSLFVQLLVGILALVLAALLLLSASAIYLLPNGALDPLVIIIFLIIGILILFGVGIDVYFLARNISVPVRELSQATRAIAEGRLDVPFTLQREDELGILADDFRQMQVELRRSREALQQEKERYAELNELKDRLLANVPHEIKTPLAAIAASLEMLEDQHLHLTPAEQRQLLASIHRSVVRLEYLIDNLLDAPTIQAGQFRVRVEATPLAPILEQAGSFIIPLLEQNQQTLQIEDRTGGMLVQADPVRITQVLVNLLSNANKYGNPMGTIEVTAAVEGKQARVQVHNDGAPIPPEDQKRLFERFARSAQTEHISGVGLGLAIAKTIIDLHGGEIGLSSSAEQGTTIWFTLPVSNEVLDESLDR